MYREPVPPAPHAVVAFGRHVIALDRVDGRRVWAWTAEDGYWSRIAITADRVLVGGQKRLACLAYATGQVLWETDSPVFASTFLVDGVELLVGGQGELACHDVTSGTLRWHEPFRSMGHGSIAMGFPGNAAQVDHSG